LVVTGAAPIESFAEYRGADPLGRGQCSGRRFKVIVGMADFKSAKADLIPPSIAPVRREAPRDIAPCPKGVRFGRAPQQTPTGESIPRDHRSLPAPVELQIQADTDHVVSQPDVAGDHRSGNGGDGRIDV